MRCSKRTSSTGEAGGIDVTSDVVRGLPGSTDISDEGNGAAASTARDTESEKRTAGVMTQHV